MKKIVFAILAALVLAAPASAQLTIGSKMKGAELLKTLSPEWTYLYRQDGHYFFVSNSTNQFDPAIWLDLGETPAEAGKTIRALYEQMESAKKGDRVQIESEGQEYALVFDKVLGTPCFRIQSITTRRAGTGVMEKSVLRKAYDYFREIH